MRCVVIGQSGQLASALAERGALSGAEVVCLGRPEVDLATSDDLVEPVQRGRPDVVVNAAAYTAVDAAESEPEAARTINVDGARLVAEAAAVIGVPVIHVSTDYVYDGLADRAYRESDPVAPKGVYGQTKLDGEAAVAAAATNHAILRTAWVYSPFGRNFVKSMLRLAEDRDEVRVVADQIGSPTSAHDLADAVLRIAGNLIEHPDNGALRGVFHVAGAGEATWADMAEAVFAASARRGGPAARVVRITTAEYPTPAARPLNSRLDLGKVAAVHGIRMPDWRPSVQACVERILSGET